MQKRSSLFFFPSRPALKKRKQCFSVLPLTLKICHLKSNRKRDQMAEYKLPNYDIKRKAEFWCFVLLQRRQTKWSKLNCTSYSHKSDFDELLSVCLFKFFFSLYLLLKEILSVSRKQIKVMFMTVCPGQHFSSSSLLTARSGPVVHRRLVTFSVSWKLKHKTRLAVTQLLRQLQRHVSFFTVPLPVCDDIDIFA